MHVLCQLPGGLGPLQEQTFEGRFVKCLKRLSVALAKHGG